MANQIFGYPRFDENGVKVLTRMDGACANMLQDIIVYHMKSGETHRFLRSEQEMAVLLIEGEIAFAWEDRREEAARSDFMKDGAYCLHVPKNTQVEITAARESEVLMQATTNDRKFESKFYTPQSYVHGTFGQGEFEGKAQRTVNTFFDYGTAPYSNMVCGEILVPQGGWSSYPPHQHPQPEVYYYRFPKPQGFGACFIGDDVCKIADGSFCAIPGGKTHPQVNAPGYPMYYVWMIRHFENAPWTDRIFDPAHAWMLEK